MRLSTERQQARVQSSVDFALLSHEGAVVSILGSNRPVLVMLTRVHALAGARAVGPPCQGLLCDFRVSEDITSQNLMVAAHLHI